MNMTKISLVVSLFVCLVGGAFYLAFHNSPLMSNALIKEVGGFYFGEPMPTSGQTVVSKNFGLGRLVDLPRPIFGCTKGYVFRNYSEKGLIGVVRLEMEGQVKDWVRKIRETYPGKTKLHFLGERGQDHLVKGCWLAYYQDDAKREQDIDSYVVIAEEHGKLAIIFAGEGVGGYGLVAVFVSDEILFLQNSGGAVNH